jgi:hypothetical protein
MTGRSGSPGRDNREIGEIGEEDNRETGKIGER